MLDFSDEIIHLAALVADGVFSNRMVAEVKRLTDVKDSVCLVNIGFTASIVVGGKAA